MPAKGRYFLNEGEEGPDQAALYEKYRLTSQHGPLLLMLLALAGAACVALVAVTFSHGVSPGWLGSGLQIWAGTLPVRPPCPPLWDASGAAGDRLVCTRSGSLGGSRCDIMGQETALTFLHHEIGFC